MPERKQFPEELFHAFAAMSPYFVLLARNVCSLEPIELFMLWYIRSSGKRDHAGQAVIQRRALTQVFQREFRHSPAEITRIIDTLQAKQLVYRTSLNKSDLEGLFGSDRGRTQVVVLLPDGNAKIEQFKSGVAEMFARLLPKMQQPLRSTVDLTLIPIATRLARWILRSMQSRMREVVDSIYEDSRDEVIPEG